MDRNEENTAVKVVLVQPDLVWEEPGSNMELLENMMLPYAGKGDVFVLPEMFLSGFTMNTARMAVGKDDLLLRRLKDLSRQLKGIIAGSIIYTEKGKYYNRFLWISPDGKTGHYDKRHLFRMGEEDRNFSPGRERMVFRFGSFRFLPQVCYDLRFPVFARYRGDYDVLVYVANWPENRQHVWETLLKARALENQCYVIGVNRTGNDGEGIGYRGGSCVLSPTGHLLAWLDNQPGTILTSLSLTSLNEFRDGFPVWKDADDFTLSQ